MANLKKEQLDEILRKHQMWLDGDVEGERAALYNADLSNADLSGANLNNAILSGADLSNADLSGADLFCANLHSATLTNAGLSGANLHIANLTNADLTNADLTNANLTDAELNNAILNSAKLTNSVLTSAKLTGAKLAELGSLLVASGNMVEIKTVQCETWPVAYTATHMQIGCQLHKLDDWWAFSDERISRMSGTALSWWQKWKPVLKLIIDTSPAI